MIQRQQLMLTTIISQDNQDHILLLDYTEDQHSETTQDPYSRNFHQSIHGGIVIISKLFVPSIYCYLYV